MSITVKASWFRAGSGMALVWFRAGSRMDQAFRDYYGLTGKYHLFCSQDSFSLPVDLCSFWTFPPMPKLLRSVSRCFKTQTITTTLNPYHTFFYVWEATSQRVGAGNRHQAIYTFHSRSLVPHAGNIIVYFPIKPDIHRDFPNAW